MTKWPACMMVWTCGRTSDGSHGPPDDDLWRFRKHIWPFVLLYAAIAHCLGRGGIIGRPVVPLSRFNPVAVCVLVPVDLGAGSLENAEGAMKLVLQSTLTCPQCGAVATETMPQDACQWFYDCKSCGAVLKPLPGDCCVYCSYGDVPCSPIQEGKTCC